MHVSAHLTNIVTHTPHKQTLVCHTSTKQVTTKLTSSFPLGLPPPAHAPPTHIHSTMHVPGFVLYYPQPWRKSAHLCPASATAATFHHTSSSGNCYCNLPRPKPSLQSRRALSWQSCPSHSITHPLLCLPIKSELREIHRSETPKVNDTRWGCSSNYQLPHAQPPLRI